MYSLNTSEVQIIDEWSYICVINKKTGMKAMAKNRCGYTSGKIYFSLIYDGKKNNLADITCGRVETLSELLKRVGLPTYRTLKKHTELYGV